MKTIVLTGCTRGLGLALAQFFAQTGHRIVGCGTNPALVAKLQNDLGELHFFSVVDVANASAVATWAETVLQRYGAPDLLVNNAAVISPNAPLWQTSAEQFDRVIDINIKGTANTIRYFVPAMVQKNSGVIVNFSSGWGRSTSPEVAPYCASKYAIEGLTQAFAQELPMGMAAVALNPGVIATDMLTSAFGESASAYPTPDVWVQHAGPFILQLGPKDNGTSPSVPRVPLD